jgi:phosphate acetyltransferase
MLKRAKTSSPIASRFLATGDMACPPELFELAASSAPKPFGFVRAIGEATLETARAAAAAKLVVPILIGEPGIIAKDAAAMGWNLSGVEIIPAEGEDGAIAAAIALFFRRAGCRSC